MPYVALNTDERRVKPSQAEKPADLWCPLCMDEMHIVQSHKHRNSFRSRHFRHNNGNDCGGESDTHAMMKEVALSKLRTIHGERVAEAEPEKELHAPYTNKERREADACITFEDRHPKYGFGIVVETQYKNKQKNLKATTEDYLRNGYSVVWLWEDQYTDDGDVRLDLGTWHTVVERCIPDREQWSGHASGYNYHWHNEYLIHDTNNSSTFTAGRVWNITEETDWKPTESEISATLPQEWLEQKEDELWKSTPWSAKFRGTQEFSFDSTRWPVRGSIPVAMWAAADGDSSPIKKPFKQAVRNGRASDVTRPETALNDIQCWSCGDHWYHTAPYSQDGVYKTCPNCGKEVDFSWNSTTGRITEQQATEAAQAPRADIEKVQFTATQKAALDIQD